MDTQPRRGEWLAVTADVLTLSRVFAAIGLVWLGTQGPDTLPMATLVCVLAWTTDQLDGWAARRADTPTRLAPADFAIDTALYAGTLAYLTLAGFLVPVLALCFVILTVAVSAIYRRKAVEILWVRLIDLASAIVIFTHKPLIGFLLLAWLALLGIIYRRRITERVPRWMGELRQLVRPGNHRNDKT